MASAPAARSLSLPLRRPVISVLSRYGWPPYARARARAFDVIRSVRGTWDSRPARVFPRALPYMLDPKAVNQRKGLSRQQNENERRGTRREKTATNNNNHTPPFLVLYRSQALVPGEDDYDRLKGPNSLSGPVGYPERSRNLFPPLSHRRLDDFFFPSPYRDHHVVFHE